MDNSCRHLIWGSPKRPQWVSLSDHRARTLECEAWGKHTAMRVGRELILDAQWVPASAVSTRVTEPYLLRLRSETVRQEFTQLAEQWRRETQHLSLISRKVAHPAYFRIVGMGEAVVPLLLEALRDRPAHWFAALRATANADPATSGASPSAMRAAWLKWGAESGLVDWNP